MDTFNNRIAIITGISGQPIFAPKIEGKPYPQGPNKPGDKYFLPFSNVG